MLPRYCIRRLTITRGFIEMTRKLKWRRTKESLLFRLGLANQLLLCSRCSFVLWTLIISDPVYERPEQSELRRQYSQQTLSNYKFVRHVSKLKDQAISN